jgi:hypothetical protein
MFDRDRISFSVYFTIMTYLQSSSAPESFRASPVSDRKLWKVTSPFLQKYELLAFCIMDANRQSLTESEYQCEIQIMPVAMESSLFKADYLLVDMEPSEDSTLSSSFQMDIEGADINTSVATLSSGVSSY